MKSYTFLAATLVSMNAHAFLAYECAVQSSSERIYLADLGIQNTYSFIFPNELVPELSKPGEYFRFDSFGKNLNLDEYKELFKSDAKPGELTKFKQKSGFVRHWSAENTSLDFIGLSGSLLKPSEEQTANGTVQIKITTIHKNGFLKKRDRSTSTRSFDLTCSTIGSAEYDRLYREIWFR